MAQQASTSIISYQPLCLVKPFFGRVPIAALDFPLRKQPTTTPLHTPTHHRPTTTIKHGTRDSALSREAQTFWPPCFLERISQSSFIQVVFVSLFFLNLTAYKPHIYHWYFYYRAFPPPGVVGVNEVAPPGYCFHCFLWMGHAIKVHYCFIMGVIYQRSKS